MGAAVVQPYAFLAFAAGGIAAGVLFCVLRALRHALKRHKICCALLDLAFWIGVTLLFLLCLWLGTGGEPRLFGFLAFGLGGVAGAFGPGSLAEGLLQKVLGGTKYFLSKVDIRYRRDT